MISVFLRNAVLSKILRNTNFTFPTYLSLHDGDPGITGADEIAGGSYARALISTTQWDAAASAQADTNVVVTFLDLPSVTLTHIGLWDAASSGNFGFGGELAAPVVIAAGEGFAVPISALLAVAEAGSV